MTVTNDSDLQVSLVPLDHRVPPDHQEAKDQPDRKGDKEAQEAVVPQDRLVFEEQPVQPGSVGRLDPSVCKVQLEIADHRGPQVRKTG